MAKTTEMVEVALSSLKPYERNAKLHPAEQIERLKESIREFGFISPCLIDSENNIIAGHGRVEAAKSLGMTEVPCVYIEGLTDEQRRAYILADNRLTELGGWDMDIVNSELESLADAGFDIGVTGFAWDEVAEIDPVDDDYTPDFSTPEPKSKLGEIYQLGEHRLMVGDSTKAEDVAALMNGDKASLLITDPPYGVDYTSKSQWLMNSGLDRTTEKLKAIRSLQTIENDVKEDDELFNFLSDSFTNARNNMIEGAVYYIWHASTKGPIFHRAATATLGEVRQLLVWVKNQMVFGRQDYQWKHEPCLYGWTDGAAHYFVNNHSYKTIIEEPTPDFNSMTKEELTAILLSLYDEEKVPTTTIHEDRPTQNILHPTMKPVRLFCRLINNSSLEGDIVLDLFAGSGTIIIAAEQLNRKAYCMEYDPHYADVIIDRWEQYTGIKAVRING